MTVEETLAACLQATSLGSSVYPDIAPDGKKAPYATYFLVTGTRINNLKGDSGLSHPRFQIDVYAPTSLQRTALKNEIRLAVQACAALKAVFLDEQALYEADTKLYRHRQDFNFWFND